MAQKTEKKQKSRISPIFKRAIAHLFTKPATTKYPSAKPVLPPDTRGRLIYEIKDCNAIDFGSGPDFRLDIKVMRGATCHVCERDCPAAAIKIVEVDGKQRPQIDLNKCIFCCQCVETCPRGAIKQTDLYELAATDKESLIMKPKYTQKDASP
ncbi:MAG: 4Fe-4S binding protein [Nitrososphaerota archaeon]|jgi:formate hydrogenlyase subunit 6/NADH:ubiquinone oxidoreductase subunit I|nr:4Fe-4S binding protein [Nitrososphaerota archaeon]